MEQHIPKHQFITFEWFKKTNLPRGRYMHLRDRLMIIYPSGSLPEIILETKDDAKNLCKLLKIELSENETEITPEWLESIGGIKEVQALDSKRCGKTAWRFRNFLWFNDSLIRTQNQFIDFCRAENIFLKI